MGDTLNIVWTQEYNSDERIMGLSGKRWQKME
jgi:hypothetical protein